MKKFFICSLFYIAAGPVSAQCFNRGGCDPSTYEIRSQLNVSIPVADQTSTSDAMKVTEDARRQLTAMSDRELDAIKSIYGADANLRASNTSTNLQENGARGTTAFVSVSNTYAVKKPSR